MNGETDANAAPAAAAPPPPPQQQRTLPLVAPASPIVVQRLDDLYAINWNDVKGTGGFSCVCTGTYRTHAVAPHPPPPTPPLHPPPQQQQQQQQQQHENEAEKGEEGRAQAVPASLNNNSSSSNNPHPPLRALKIMDRAQMTGRNADIVLHEREILCRAQNRHIVKLHHVVQDADRVAFELDLMQTDLYEYLRARQQHQQGNPALTEYDAAQIMYQLLDAVAYLHDDMDVVHRDIKLENILFNSVDDIKLADFGLAKLIQMSPGMVRNTPCGTNFYIAPEIIRAVQLQGSTPFVTTKDEVKFIDLWSSGVVMYVLLAGYPPFQGTIYSRNERQRLLDAIDNVGVLFPTEQWSHISEAAKQLVRRLLTTDPAQRITAAEARRDPFFEILQQQRQPPPQQDQQPQPQPQPPVEEQQQQEQEHEQQQQEQPSPPADPLRAKLDAIQEGFVKEEEAVEGEGGDGDRRQLANNNNNNNNTTTGDGAAPPAPPSSLMQRKKKALPPFKGGNKRPPAGSQPRPAAATAAAAAAPPPPTEEVAQRSEEGTPPPEPRQEQQ